MRRKGTRQKCLNLQDYNVRKRVFRHNVILPNVWYAYERKYNPTYDLRCNWCKASYWWVTESERYPRLCSKCQRFLRELEEPSSLWALRQHDCNEIPF